MVRNRLNVLIVSTVSVALVALLTLIVTSYDRTASRAHDEAVARWEAKEPLVYSFDYGYCSGMCASCLLRVTVEDGAVTDAVEREGQCSSLGEQEAPTIEEIFAMEERDRSAENTDSVDIRYDRPGVSPPPSTSVVRQAGLTAGRDTA